MIPHFKDCETNFNLQFPPRYPFSPAWSHIYTNVHNVAETSVINFHISDHSPVFVLIKCICTKILKKVVKARNYDFLTYKNMLTNCNWDNVMVMSNVNCMWDSILKSMKDCLSMLCPVRRLVLPVFTLDWLNPK